MIHTFSGPPAPPPPLDLRMLNMGINLELLFLRLPTHVNIINQPQSGQFGKQ